mgnify:CR=1 FL=1
MKKLSDIPKQNNFKTPDGYFENLNKDIMSEIDKEEKKKPVSAYQIFKPYIYMAAAMVILVGAIKFGLNVLVDQDPVIKPDVETIADTDAVEALYGIYEDDIAFYEYLEEDTDVYANNDISDEEIEEYLSNYYIEYELMYE